MKKTAKIFFILLLLYSLFPKLTLAVTPKPITGTFVMLDFPMTTMSQADSYFDDMAAAGMDTAVLLAMGSAEDKDVSGNLITRTYFSDSTMKNFLTSAHNHGFSVYLGLSGNNPAKLNPENSIDRSKLIDFSKQLISQAKNLSQSQGWGWDGNFIKGWYIPQEMSVTSFSSWKTLFSFYTDTANSIKSIEPNKQILLSPYFLENDSYDSVLNNITYALNNSKIDIYAIQDGVGADNVKTFAANNTHFQAARDAIQKSGKPVLLWDNAETFYCPGGCSSTVFLNPTNFLRLRWQLRTANDYTAKTITWIHQNSMAIDTNLNSFSKYSSTYSLRQALRQEYLNKPIIVAGFEWSGNIVIKGYNFVSPGAIANLYLHYYTTSGSYQTANRTTSVITTGDAGKKYSEIWVSLSSFPNMDFTRPFDIAIQNQSGYVSYFRSQSPDTQPEPSFPEIKPISPPPTNTPILPTPTKIPPTNTPIPALPGDADHNGTVNLVDFSIWKNEYLRIVFTQTADFNHNGSVGLDDFSLWKQTYLAN